MSDHLESRLRRHLADLDNVAVGNESAVNRATRAASKRLRRRRQTAIGLTSAVFVVLGGTAIWSRRGITDDVQSAPSTVSNPSTIDSSIPAEPDPTTTVTAVTTTIAPPSQWTPIATDPRGPIRASDAVWTGTEALVFGGFDPDGNFVTGGTAYEPTSDTWRVIADPPATVTNRRINPLVAWTGTEVLVIGGDNPDGSLLLSYGTAFDPAHNTWRGTTLPNGFISNRSPSAWTGSELLVWPWGGRGSPDLGFLPLAYDPVTDEWRGLGHPPIVERERAASVWTGEEWIIWGGTTGSQELDDGAAYNPATDTWRVIAAAPLAARRVAGVWTGSEMIVTAGSSGGNRDTGNGEFAHADGAAYNPATDSWRSITSGPGHPGFIPLWTGTHMLMFAKGGVSVYDGASDVWIDTCCSNANGGETPVWTGTVALLFGGGQTTAGGSAFTPPSPSIASPETCTDPDVDVATEPDWRQFADYREWTRDGCLVRIDVLADRPGPQHCGWESVRVIITGSPLRSRYTTANDAVEYVRDPNNVMGLDTKFEPDATLPETAIDTGYRSGDESLWMVPGDDSAIYVVTDDGVEQWPLAAAPICR